MSTEAPAWRKSSYSGGSEGDCLEFASNFPDIVAVRDTKTPTGPTLTFSSAAWSAFLPLPKREAPKG
ncbi:DUF397 domain-containing protein [Streptomyces candidus]|uniref:DUF397 domain-containing protein n=1 Tax=Streptomyces candidus TaxID=67283 RepID=A0A7X0LQV8_9ACTN|nr:DUF397 domain-containing protein [Streptomyces candidus]MBB6437472.1 hypothetical protein [Streptomyces candidus]GHH54289.1 hypothetical protein GCM10018773_56970 [Streptomyces candidus]